MFGGFLSRKSALLQCSMLSDWQNIYRVQYHGFHDFISSFKHDLMLYMNFSLYDLVLIAVINDNSYAY